MTRIAKISSGEFIISDMENDPNDSGKIILKNALIIQLIPDPRDNEKMHVYLAPLNPFTRKDEKLVFETKHIMFYVDSNEKTAKVFAQYQTITSGIIVPETGADVKLSLK